MIFQGPAFVNTFVAVRIFRTTNLCGTQLVSGRFYLFKYANFKVDPYPLILYMNSHYGVYPNTGHLHRYIQGINIHYLPKHLRLPFYEKWTKLNRNERWTKKNFQTFYSHLIKDIPNIDFCIRRYFYRPNEYITSLVPMHQDLLIDYLTNPLKAIAKAWNIKQVVTLAWKIKQMSVQKKPKKS